MRINLGSDKTAIMVIARGAAARMRWHLGKRLVPVVTDYKYMGCRIAASCSWDPMVRATTTKLAARTQEVTRWARANEVCLDLANRC